MELNRINESNSRIDHIKSKSTPSKVQSSESMDIVQAPSNPNYYRNYQGVTFKGHPFIDDVKSTEKQKTVELDNSTEIVKSYKKDDREYFLTENGKLYRVRYSKNQDKNAETVLAAKLYNLAGVKTPDMKLLKSGDYNGYISEYKTGLNSLESNPRALYDAFAADAWLGNWNTFNHGNTQIDNDGNAVKIVTSGSLNYRASGKKKDKFDKTVDELSTMRSSDTNPVGAELLKDMTNEDLKVSLGKVANIKTNDIVLAVQQSQIAEKQQMIDTLIARRDFIKAELNKLEKQDFTEPQKETTNTVIEEISENPIIRKRKSQQLDDYLNGEFIYEKEDKNSWYYNAQKKDIDKVKQDIEYNPEKRKIYEDILDIAFWEYKGDRTLYYANKLEQFAQYDIEHMKIFAKLATYQKQGYSMPINEPREYDKLKDIDAKKLDYMVNTQNLVSVESILEMNQKSFDTIKTGANLAQKYGIEDGLVNNIITFLSDETGQVPDYKKEALEKLLAKDDEFKQPYSSYVSGGPKCLLSDFLILCKDKDTTDKIFNDIMPEYEQIVEKYDRLSAVDIKHLLEADDKDFVQEKIKFTREIFGGKKSGYSDSLEYNAALRDFKTQEDIDIYKSLEDIGLNYQAIKHQMFWAKRDDKYDYKQLEFAKIVGKEKFGNDLYEDLTSRYRTARWQNDIETEKQVVEEFKQIKESGLTNLLINDRMPIGNPSYWPDPTKKRRLYKEEIYFLNNLPKQKLDKIKKYINIEGRQNQFSFNQLFDLIDLEPHKLKLIEPYMSPTQCGKEYSYGALIACAEFDEYKNYNNITELNTNEKRGLLKKLVKYNSDILNQDCAELIKVPLLPKNKDEYCSLMNAIVSSIYMNPKPISEAVKTDYYESLKNLENIYGEFLNVDLKKAGAKLDLAYPRDNFKSDIEEKLSHLSNKERKQVTNYFGFELINTNSGVKMSGYPINNNEDKYDLDDTIKKAIEDVRPHVKAFTEDNQILPNKTFSPQLVKDLNNIMRAFPELYTIIGTKQHDTHSYTVDMHTLNVLQTIMKNPRYKYLPENDRRILQTATLFHDLTKIEGEIDKTHPAYSAYDAYQITKKLNMPESQHLQIYQLIKNHDFLEKYNGKVWLGDNKYRELTQAEKTEIAKNYAFELKYGNNLKMESILTDADLKSVQRDGSFFRKFGGALQPAEAHIANYIDEIQNTAIHLPQTKIPKASELKVDNDVVRELKTLDSKGNTIKNKVICLKPGVDMKPYGFKENIKSDDINVLTHGLDYDEQSVIFNALGQVDSDALLSTAYVNYGKGNYHVFRKQGFVLDVASEDIHAAYFRDFGSGCRKNIEELKKSYLFRGYGNDTRTYISSEIKKELNLTDEEYKKLYPKIADKSINEIEQENPMVAQGLRNIINNMEEGKRSHGRQYNEILVTRPKIQAVFCQSVNNNVDQIPEFLRKYAEENDVPIIYFGE